MLLTGNGRLFITAGIDLQQSFVSDDVQAGSAADAGAYAHTRRR